MLPEALMDEETIKKRVENEEDFIYCIQLNHSITSLVNKHPDGVDDKRIAKLLLITPQQVKEIFERALKKIRATLKITKGKD
jgi:hypothetical protein